MLAARIHHLESLLASSQRPGGMYPVFELASHLLPAEERESGAALLAGSSLADVWAVWCDPARTALDRAQVLAHHEPAHAYAHWLAADLSLRDDDARAEPYPQLRAEVARRRPGLAEDYAALLARFAEEYDRDSEAYVSRRGAAYYADEVSRLFVEPGERACFARAVCAWGCAGTFVRTVLSAGELAERSFEHRPDGAHAELRLEALVGLACPELLVSLRLWAPSMASAVDALQRAQNLRSLDLRTSDLEVSPDEARSLAALPLEELAISVAAATRAPWPAWISALPALRRLELSFTEAGVDSARVDLGAAQIDCTALEELRLSGVGRLPAQLGRCSALRTLTVRGFGLESLPDSLTELVALETLSVDPVRSLPPLPAGFDRLRDLRSVRLGHLATEGVPGVLLEMPWLERVELVSGHRWAKTEEAKLRAALPDAYVFVAFTGDARG